jgi:pimeloyl-ACP methyl ester carboxylesterase
MTYTRALPAAAVLSLMLGLAACGETPVPVVSSQTDLTNVAGGTDAVMSAPDLAEVQTYGRQKLSWTECDPTLIPFQEISQALGDRVQCADVRVPLDWHNPRLGKASFALLRVKAPDQSQHQGSIFFNPGGPGGDGLLFGALYAFLWGQADVSTKSGAALKQLSEKYDLIGFSPRGTGQSFRLTCGSNEQSSAEQYPSEDRSPANVGAQLRNARLVAQACLKNPLTPYINTDQTARDLNLARQLLGDGKLNYVGYSYGTWLGAWYAKLFPKQTGRFLLDGNTTFDKTWQEQFDLYVKGFERAFRESALAYTARQDGVFGLGSSKEAVYEVYNAFPGALKLTLISYPASLFGALYSGFGTVSIPYKLVAARGFSAVLKAHPDLKTNDELAPLLANYSYSANPEVNKVAVSEALLMLGTYVGIVNNLTGPVELGNGGAVNIAVLSNDTPYTQDEAYWVKAGDEAAKESPLIGGSLTSNPAIYWTRPTTRKPETPDNLPPILLLQNEYDPATPKEGALPAWKSLPGARMIFVDNEAAHTAFPYDTECVDVGVAQFFLDGKLPENPFTVCPAKPLPTETQVYKLGGDYQTGDGLSAQSVSTQSLNGKGVAAQGLKVSAFGSSQVNQDALKLLREIIARNALKPNILR